MADSDNYHEVSTMSKREYYTLKDKGKDMTTPAAVHQEQQELEQKQKEIMARGERKLQKGEKKYNVILLDGAVVPFVVDAKTSASELYDAVCDYVGLHEKEYFGLCYSDSSQTYFWLNNDKRIDQQLKKSSTHLELMVKFYPPDPDQLREKLTCYLMTLQLRQNMIADQLQCSFTTYVILGSYVVQSEMGDFDENTFGLAYQNECPFCPEEYRQQELLDRVSELHRCHRGMMPEEADVHFLLNAKKLAMYGVHQHSARDAKGDDVVVGVYHGGVVVYRNLLRIGRFSWPRILRVSIKESTVKLEIRMTTDETKGKDPATAKTGVDFKCADKKMAKRMWRNIVEHHGFFRLKSPEKPSKPKIPGTFNRKWNYTGPTAQQASSQPYSEQPEVIVTQGMRKSFRKKNDGAHREMQQQAALAQQMQRERQLPNLGEHAPDRWAMCPADSDALLVPSLDAGRGNCMWPSQDSEWRGVRANKGVGESGKWYYETTVGGDLHSDTGVPARIGWSTAGSSLILGDDDGGVGFGAGPNGEQKKIYSAGLPQQYGIDLQPGDVVGAFLDIDEGVVEFSVNNQMLGPAFQLSDQQLQSALFPAACSQGDTEMNWNFGDDPSRPLAYPPSAPWKPVGSAPLPAHNPRAWRLNPRDVSGSDLTVSPDRCCAQARNGWQGIRADRGLQGSAGGKYYYEVEPQEEGGLGRVGWATEDGSLQIGSDANGWGYGADTEGFGLNGIQGKRMHGNEIDNYGEPFSKGDTVGCLIDLDNGVMQFSRNGRQLGEAYQLSPNRFGQDTTYFPAVCMRDQTLDVNLGQRPFKYQPSADWLPVCLAPDGAVRLSKTASQGMNVPSVDQKYDTLHSQRPKIIHTPNAPAPELNGRSNVTVHESRNETEELGDPEEEIQTYTDEHGNVITKRVVRQKRKHQVVTSKIVETRGYGPAPNTEQLDRAMNGGDQRPTVRKNLLLERDEGDDALDDIIFAQTGFSRDDTIVDENVNDFSMSTLDSRRPQHESEI